MKKLFRSAMLAVAVTATTLTAGAQMSQPLPVDPDVRIGKLDNGLTYYIRHNEKPKGQADFYIAQKVGSILENDDQRGLAHFLEHMCFNGTTHFPGNEVISWLETKGVKFGYNLNAYTSIDETVYNISNVPVANTAVQDSCLLILHDWANDLLLAPEEIDKERGVIHEEWRTTNKGQMRIINDVLPIIYPGSKYGYRMPIGTLEVIDNFPYQALRDYYEAWYRPDQQGIIVVGDIDVDRIEGKIKEMFADIEMPADAPERVYEQVADTEGTLYGIGSDKELQTSMWMMMFKTDAVPTEMKGDMTYLVQKYVMDMIQRMLSQRLSDISNTPDSPFAGADADYGNFFLSKTKDAFSISGIAKDDNLLPVAEAVYRELLRAQRGGFTVGEYERARKEFLSGLESEYNNRNDRESSEYVYDYVRNFIDSEPIPSLEDQYQIMQMLAPMIPVEAINTVLPELITADNRVVLAMVPEKEGVEVPTQEQFAEIFAKVDAEEIEPYVDQMKEEPLIPELPAPGKIVSETVNEQWGATELTLSNGVRVLVKPTNFKADEILFAASTVGGTSIFPDSDATELKFLSYALMQSGLGDYTNSDLQKYLQGKQASIDFSADDYEREISGSTTPKDLPTLMELIYMTFTSTVLNPDEYQALQNTIAGIYRNRESDPQVIFNRDVMKSLFANPRRQIITVDEIMAADRERIQEIAHQMTANAADYLFIFTGNVDLDTLRPLLEQYIATLPADAAAVNHDIAYNPTLTLKDGSSVDSFTAKMETPQTYVFIGAVSPMEYTAKNAQTASIAGQILSKRLLDTVREDMGAVYSIGAYGNLSRLSTKNAQIMTQFPMKPEMKQEVLDFIKAEMQRMTENITPEELAKVTEYLAKDFTEAKEKNESWLNAIEGWNANGVDTFNGNLETLSTITVEDVQNFVRNVLDADNLLIVTLDPEAAE